MQIISHAPTWVWVLLVALVLRGIKALQDRTMSLTRLLLLPVIFLVWGGYALCQDTETSILALVSAAIGLPLGAFVGWRCWRTSPGLRDAGAPGHVVRAGSALPLCFIVVAFISRFVMAAYLHTHQDAVSSAWMMVIVGLWSGAIDGVFWGGSFNLLWRYRVERQQRGRMSEA
ncbi:DUF6622 family protein [Zymobacter palmae]|uniref:Arabinose efflux permease n=1 Tax=Zymobacter palmae TaxID=33074 RepID=A0A348HFY5_9GAMM|nr:DUF6622 family protein [Zymobacter palmae]BBG30537.1 arabinose efflux permease [Zymobacter palmae]